MVIKTYRLLFIAALLLLSACKQRTSHSGNHQLYNEAFRPQIHFSPEKTGWDLPVDSSTIRENITCFISITQIPLI